MKRSIIICFICLITAYVSFSQAPRRFYKFEVVETTNPNLEVFAAPSINDYGDIAFSGRRTPGGGTVFLNVIGQPNVDLMPGSGTNPVNFVSGRVQINNTQQVMADGFTSLGQSPAVSDLCESIVFYGDLNATGAQTLGTNPAPGIFASIEIDKKTFQRKIVRLAGRLIENISAPGGNDDGYCDPGETCMQGELGFTLGGTPIFFNSFSANNRVAVTHQSSGAKGIEDDIFVVSFLATPNIGNDNPARPFTSQLGLWTLTTQIKNEGSVMREKPVVAVPVIQVGDVVNSRTISTINVWDQIASVRTKGSNSESPGDHRLAFHVGTNNGNMILRANRNVETPVIFIPGIMGSRLAECSDKSCSSQTERWPGIGIGLLTGANTDRLLPSQNANILATDVIRSIPVYGDVYQPMLTETLSMSGGLREYQVEGNPERRKTDGCDLSQRFNNPTLFVFAYDWRLSNSENANKLKDYIGCIQKFYPGTKVDIVAHSMGGLIARRQIIANPENHNILKLITIGSPFLGAPGSLDVMETGRLQFLPGLFQKRIRAFHPNRIKNLAKESPGVHELFPSDAYFTLGGRPFAEETFDINGDGTVNEEYDYPEAFEFYNERFSTAPYFTNEQFHGVTGQDDWRNDDSDVEYFHIFGEQSIADTVEQIVAIPKAKKPLSITRLDYRFVAEKGVGDRTVLGLAQKESGT